MFITIRELACSGNTMGTIRVPLAKGSFGPMEDEEIETLSQFEGLAMEVSPEALPLELYLGNGSSRSLAIYPNRGGTIKLARDQEHLSIKARGNHSLLVFRDPIWETIGQGRRR